MAGARLFAFPSGAQILPLAARLRAWGATQTGTRYLLGLDIVVTLDADGLHEPDSLPALLDYQDVGVLLVTENEYHQFTSRDLKYALSPHTTHLYNSQLSEHQPTSVDAVSGRLPVGRASAQSVAALQQVPLSSSHPTTSYADCRRNHQPRGPAQSLRMPRNNARCYSLMHNKAGIHTISGHLMAAGLYQQIRAIACTTAIVITKIGRQTVEKGATLAWIVY